MGIMTFAYHRDFEACCGGASGEISIRETRGDRPERSLVSGAAMRRRRYSRHFEVSAWVSVAKSVKGAQGKK